MNQSSGITVKEHPQNFSHYKSEKAFGLHAFLILSTLLWVISSIGFILLQKILFQGELISDTLVFYGCILFVFSGGVSLIAAILGWQKMKSVSLNVLTLGVLICASALGVTVWENYQTLELGHVGLNNIYQVSVLLMVTVGLSGLYWIHVKNVKVMISPLSVLLSFGAIFTLWLLSIGQGGAQELVPALQSYWLPWHVAANFIGYGAFMIAAVAGVALLWNKNPKTEKTLKQVMDGSIAFGFPIFGIAIFLGCLWAYEAWGGYWSWDPKETWALIVWLNYAAYLHAVQGTRVKARTLAWWAVAGFFLTLFCYLGVNMFLNGLHSYGQLG